MKVLCTCNEQRYHTRFHHTYFQLQLYFNSYFVASYYLPSIRSIGKVLESCLKSIFFCYFVFTYPSYVV